MGDCSPWGAWPAGEHERLKLLTDPDLRQVDVYSPEPDLWSDGSWPSLRRMRLSHGCCVAPSDHGGVIITGGGSAEVRTRGSRGM